MCVRVFVCWCVCEFVVYLCGCWLVGWLVGWWVDLLLACLSVFRFLSLSITLFSVLLDDKVIPLITTILTVHGTVFAPPGCHVASKAYIVFNIATPGAPHFNIVSLSFAAAFSIWGSPGGAKTVPSLRCFHELFSAQCQNLWGWGSMVRNAFATQMKPPG